jgi:hypothetical protein
LGVGGSEISCTYNQRLPKRICSVIQLLKKRKKNIASPGMSGKTKFQKVSTR